MKEPAILAWCFIKYKEFLFEKREHVPLLKHWNSHLLDMLQDCMAQDYRALFRGKNAHLMVGLLCYLRKEAH
jgi:hypothetical protein